MDIEKVAHFRRHIQFVWMGYYGNRTTVSTTVCDFDLETRI